MARHSKNNTAHSIFTQGEKSMIQDWGTVRQRLGAESFKALDQCNLCLGSVVVPVICGKGHIFCRECLVRYALDQKDRIRKDSARWERQQEDLSEKQIEAQECLLSTKEAAFRTAEEHIPTLQSWKSLEEERKYGLLTPEEALLARARDNLKTRNTLPEDSLRKEELIKQSFWVPEVAPTAQETVLEQPSQHINCPVAPKHHIKVKKMISVRIMRDVGSGSPQCWNCLKVMTHHSAGVLRGCGHLICMECGQKFCKEAGSCIICSSNVSPGDLIPLVSKGTMFSSHNEVEASTKKPVFIC